MERKDVAGVDEKEGCSTEVCVNVHAYPFPSRLKARRKVRRAGRGGCPIWPTGAVPILQQVSFKKEWNDES